jgi:hypothetical protein
MKIIIANRRKKTLSVVFFLNMYFVENPSGKICLRTACIKNEELCSFASCIYLSAASVK